MKKLNNTFNKCSPHKNTGSILRIKRLGQNSI